MELNQIECGNKSYTPKSVDPSKVEDTEYLHIIVEMPSVRRVPRTEGTLRSFIIWRPNQGSCWMPFPVSEHDRLRALCLDKKVPPCESDDQQNEHIDAMVLLIDGEVVVVDA